MSVKHTNLALLAGVAFSTLSFATWGQKMSNWRAFRLEDGLPDPACASLTVTPQGHVLARNLFTNSITELDGYSANTIPCLENVKSRIYQSPGGQLWAVAPEGLAEFKDDSWLLHPVPEIASHLRPFARGSTLDSVPLCPVRQGIVLFLLPHGLFLFNCEDPEHQKIELLRSAAHSALHSFSKMTIARDGGLWLSGERGLAKIPGPVRNLRPETPWNESIPPATLLLRNFQEPHEDENGGVTLVAESTKEARKLVVRFDGQSWKIEATGGEKLRQSWRGPDDSCWVIEGGSLFQWEEGTDMSESGEISARRFYDIAVDSAGAFWLATSEGLFRYAPPTWRSPRTLTSIASPVHGLLAAPDGSLWFISGNALHRLHDESFQHWPLPPAATRTLPATHALFSLKNGALLVDAGDQLLLFQPNTGAFSTIPQQNDRRLKILGTLPDGALCVQALAPSLNTIQTYDGTRFTPFRAALPGALSSGELSCAFITRNGDLWLGTDEGLAWRHENKWRLFAHSDKTAPEGAQCFAELPDGKLWCATADKLWEFDGRNWTPLRRALDRINDLLPGRDGSVWVASSAGLYRLFHGGWVENGPEEGIPSPDIRQLCEDLRGRFWVATAHGLTLYHPEADPDPPQARIQGLSPEDKSIPQGRPLTLTFTGEDKWKFTPRDRLLFSYRLDERDWSEFGDANHVSLENLPAGKHYFQLRAMDRNSNIAPQPARLEFTIALPWYREARLLIISSAGLAGALFFAALAFNRHRQLLRSYAEVERKVSERTQQLELASRELVQSQKMNALGTLAAGIAHDFNNILSIIKGSAQLIEDHLDEPPKILTRVARIKTVVEQGAGIVKAMLGFSRDSSLQPALCQLNSVVEDTTRLLGDRFLREVQVSFQPASDLPEIPASRDFIQQILLNFIFNAAESMSGRKQVLLATHLLDKLPEPLVLKPASAHRYLAISVRDFGCGIPPENLPRIFEPFFTTKALSARRGTGLGLSMVYELAKKMVAGLAVQSAPLRGSTFTLILPVPALPEQTPVINPESQLLGRDP